MQTRLLAVLIVILLLAGGIAAVLLGGSDSASSSAAAPGSRTVDAAAPAGPATLAAPELDEETSERVSVDDAQAPALPENVAAAPAGTIRTTFLGRFVDANGGPLAGVELNARLVEGRTSSGADGRFQLELELPEWQEDRRVPVLTWLAGYESRLLKPEAWVDRPFDLGDIVLGSGGTILCTVVNQQRVPVSGVRVLGTGVQAHFGGPTTTAPQDSFVEGKTDGAGQCLLEGVPEGDVRIWAGAEDLLWSFQEVRVVASRQSEVELMLTSIDEEDIIELIVLASDGSPVPSAKIQYHYASEGRSGSGGSNADEQGRYRHHLRMRVPHDFTGADPEDRYRPGLLEQVRPGARGQVLQLQELRSVILAVSEPGGAPVDSFSVRTEMISGADRRLPSQNLAAEPEHGGEIQVLLPSGPFEAMIVSDGYQTERLGPLDPQSIGPRLAVQLTPLPGVLGRVLDGAGRPVAGAEIRLARVIARDSWLTINGFPCRSHKGSSSSGTSDDDGHFRLTLRENGRFVLRTEADGFAPSESDVLQLEALVGARGLEVELGQGGSLAGEVLMPPGESSAGVIVGISRGDGFGETQRTDAKGNYRFDRLLPGRWLVERRSEQISRISTSSSSSDRDGPVEIPWSCEIWTGRTTDFDLDLRGKELMVVEGQLSFAGSPCAGWNVNLLTRDDSRSEVDSDTLDPQGRFRLSADDAGEYALRFSGTWKEPPFLFLTQDLELWKGVLDWERDLPIGRVEGHIAPGLLGEDTRLHFQLTGPDGIAVMAGFRPAADGSFVMPGVPAGPGRITLSGSQGEAKDFSVPAGGTLRVEFP